MSRWTRDKDPQAVTEAQKYERPVPSRDYILQLLSEAESPLLPEAIIRGFGLTEEEDHIAVQRRLSAMERDGQLLRNRSGAYGIVDKMGLIKGTVQGHREGFGFLIPEDGSDDLYLSPRQMRKVFEGDKVLVCMVSIDRRGRREGSIVEILERNTHSLVGRYFEEGGVGFIDPENKRITHRILITHDNRGNACSGQWVMVEVIAQPEMRQQAQARVVEVLGDHLAPGMEIDVAIRAHQLPFQFPEEVLTEAQSFSTQVQEADKKNRVDLRSLPLVTIDGEDAKDFDDAVYCEPRKSGGWKLIVAIADVSHYVTPGNAMDSEAKIRGNSVYFPGHVIPMLPENLSNGLCSLNANVDRLCMVCEMHISAKGKMTRHVFYEGVMCSQARLTYTDVGAYIAAIEKGTKQTAFGKQYPHLVKPLNHLYEVYTALRHARAERGAIDFDTVETKIVFGDNRKIKNIVPVVRNEAHRLIEECMLCANVAAAKVLNEHELPVLYRNHDNPKPEKLLNLITLLGGLGLSLKGGTKATPKDYQAIMVQIADRPDRHFLQTVLLRSMNQAKYSPNLLGHFGLNYPAYAHFTSPIRRYPDLLLHRALRYLIRSSTESAHVLRVTGAKKIARKGWLPQAPKEWVELGEGCSITERRADEATRDAVNWLKCEFMLDRIGEVYDGVISSVTSFGLFVELKDIFVEGLVHVSSLVGDYYRFDPVRHRLSGERSGVSYRLADPVQVRVMRVNLDDRKIDFELLADAPKTAGKKPSKKAADKAKGKSAPKSRKPVESKSTDKPKTKRRRS